MKKIILLIIVLLIPFKAVAFEIPTEAQEYLEKSQVGTPYWNALKQEQPFLLIFASGNDLFSLVKLAPVGEMVYNDFRKDYNFCILNTKDKENRQFAKLFDLKTLPSVYIINTKARTYSYVEKKYYNKKDMRRILTEYKNGTLK